MSRDHVTAERHVAVSDLGLSVTVFGAHGTHMTRSHGATSESMRTRLQLYDQTDTTVRPRPPREPRRPCPLVHGVTRQSHTHCMRPPGRSLSSRRPALSLSTTAPTRTYTLSQPYHVHCMALDTAHLQASMAFSRTRTRKTVPFPRVSPTLSNGTRPAPAISPLISIAHRHR